MTLYRAELKSGLRKPEFVTTGNRKQNMTEKLLLTSKIKPEILNFK